MDPNSYYYMNGQYEKLIPQNVLLMHMRTCFYTPCTFSVLIDVCTELRDIMTSAYCYYFSSIHLL
jgi:hypothetical protein